MFFIHCNWLLHLEITVWGFCNSSLLISSYFRISKVLGFVPVITDELLQNFEITSKIFVPNLYTSTRDFIYGYAYMSRLWNIGRKWLIFPSITRFLNMCANGLFLSTSVKHGVTFRFFYANIELKAWRKWLLQKKIQKHSWKLVLTKRVLFILHAIFFFSTK